MNGPYSVRLRPTLEKAELVEEVGRENITPHVQAALARAREVHSGACDDADSPG